MHYGQKFSQPIKKKAELQLVLSLKKETIMKPSKIHERFIYNQINQMAENA